MIAEHQTLHTSAAGTRAGCSSPLECQSNLTLLLGQCEAASRVHNGAMVKLLLCLCGGMLTGDKPPPLTQEMINQLAPAALAANDVGAEESDDGAGAPGDDAKCSSTSPKAGGQKG